MAAVADDRRSLEYAEQLREESRVDAEAEGDEITLPRASRSG